VVSVGPNTTSFQAGDRVLGFAAGSDSKINKSSEGAFQEYVVLRSELATKIPSEMAFEKAAVIPLGLATAACGMFQKDQLALQLPTSPPNKSTGKTLIVWGGSTSVGCNAIQLGVAAGYEVFTTASPKNFDLVTRLGAAKVWDYKSATVVPDMIKALKGKKTAGALTMGEGAAVACMKILDQSEGDKFISMATYPLPTDAENLSFLTTIYTMGTWMTSFKTKGLLKGIKSNFIFSSSICTNEVGAAIFRDFLPRALEAGALVPAPEPQVVGEGLDSIQAALDYQRKGVSALKVVVTL